MSKPHSARELTGLLKAPTGIVGFDDVTLGGLPAGRPTLICGAAGCGKTLFGITFLVNGATLCDEPGVFMTFEERPEDLEANFRSLGYDLNGLAAAGKLIVDHVRVERSEIEEAGEYDLEGLFVRLGFAVDRIGAKRVVLDTIESLFAGFTDQAILRAELRRLFGWLKERGLTAVITGERGEGQLTRHGLEEYVSDCVILLDNRVEDQIATRRLRVVKYRGSSHGTNEFPFLIDEDGISVLPITAPRRNLAVCNEIVSSGIPGLDAMIRNGGFYRGSTILVSGVSGTGKTTMASHFVNAACLRGERCTFFSFEESAEEICRNARSVGLDLHAHVAAGLLRFEWARPSLYGLEMHLARMQRDIETFKPAVVVIDAISAFRGPAGDVQSILLRTVDLLKSSGITAMFTSLRSGASRDEGTDHGLSSIMDSWIKLVDVEENGERNRILYLIKSRGTSHSNQLREFRMTDRGIELIDAYIGPEGVLTGTARITQEARDRAAADQRERESNRRQRQFARRREAVRRQIEELEAALQAEEDEEAMLLGEDELRDATLKSDQAARAIRRRAAE
ncbi:circadian clock protein KaiC [Rhodomicrobium sp. Az07]|uniref:circadian clock protein KaiC n=1 Tax=Rhodomicrobium sp. Az07 TaxID=2839034 RepID=UPI001BE86E4D|nr:circadian clock protein KaiC [Rhodomicrobium sp. Az07]MBT3071613.1 circadian clock protein KaiC [Rhodomicrobium sp. Az07]